MSNILIRCDSSNIIGTGHVMRCLNLCEYYPENIYTFICRNFNMNISEKILNAGYSLILLNYNIEPNINNYKTWIGKSDDEEFLDLVEIIKNSKYGKYDEIILDHYGIDCNIESKLKEYINKIVVISDIFEYNHYCDEFINYNTNDLEMVKNINNNRNTIFKIGYENIIINKKFRECKKKEIFRNNVEKICLMLGGSDPLNYTLQILKLINDYVMVNNLVVYIIIGKSNNNIESINKFIENKENKNKNNYILKFDLSYDELIELYMDIDLCIGSLSITAYERLFLNIPQICLKIVENQNIQNLKEFNICNLDNILDKIINKL